MYFRRIYPDGRIVDSTPVVYPEGTHGRMADRAIGLLDNVTRSLRRYRVVRMERTITATATEWAEVPNDGAGGLTPPVYRSAGHQPPRPDSPAPPPPPASGGHR